MKRNTEKGETFEFEVSRENFDFMENWFEKPTEKEMVGGIIDTNNFLTNIYRIAYELINDHLRRKMLLQF